MGAFVVWENPPSTLSTYNESTTSSLQTQATGLSQLCGGKEHCHLLATCVHYRGAGGKGREELPGSPSQLQQVPQGPFPPQGGRDKHAVLGFTVDTAGAPDTHAGERDISVAHPAGPSKAKRPLPESCQPPSRANPLRRARERLNQRGHLHRPGAREKGVVAPHAIPWRTG